MWDLWFEKWAGMGLCGIIFSQLKRGLQQRSNFSFAPFLNHKEEFFLSFIFQILWPAAVHMLFWMDEMLNK